LASAARDAIITTMARLRVEASPDDRLRAATVELSSLPFVIGRLHGCSLEISDVKVSRRHAEIRDADAGFWVLDLGGANGTTVNGVRVDKAWLAHGDRIEIGRTTLVFEEREEQSAADEPATRSLPPPPAPVALPPLPAGEAANETPSGASEPAGDAVTAPPRRSSIDLWVALGCLTIMMLPVVAGVGWWLLRSRSPEVTESSGPTEADAPAPDRELVELELGVANAPPIEVTMGRELGSAKISASRGGTVESKDGLLIRVPPGALPDDRTITIRSATVPPPTETVALIGGGDARLETLAAWEVDAGPSGDLFPGEIELTTRVAEGATPLYAAISIDGRNWNRVPTTIDGNLVTFRTRHFCPVTIIGLLQATAVVLPIVASTFLVIERASELPERFHPYAPFVGLDVNPAGFQIFWSKSLAGVDKATGFRDEKGYRAELERVAKEYQALGGAGSTGAASLTAEITALKKKHLMPDKVREVEDALLHAQSYLASRRIAAPALSLPVYVVPTLGKNAGLLHNPWAGRRYMLVGADSGTDVIWTAALHELFHHYQTGYVWLDRTGHLPFMEASALLMEREAIADYKAAKKPFNAGEGLVLAQMIVYRNGLDGPKEWKEEPVRLHGYGLTWFLEYLRDEKYVGILKKNDAKAFHAALLTEWGRRWTGALHKGLVWAAGSERELASAYMDFARTKVLQGRIDGCGSKNPYGGAYNSCPFMDSPFAAHAGTYGLPASKLDLAKTPVVTLGDDAIRPWSIQFYEISAKGTENSAAVVRVPRAWLPESGPSRGVFLRESAGEDDVESILDADLAEPSHENAFALLPVDPASYAYVVDTGQSGSSWFSSNDPMTVFLLGPPDNVKSEVAGKKQKITWDPPVAASTPGLVHAVRVYVAGSTMPERTVKIDATSVELDVDGSGRAIELTTAVEVGKDGSGQPAYLESPRSAPVGSADAGGYEMCIDIFAEVPKKGSECAAMNHHWFFDDMKACFPVKVLSDGRLQFSHQWTAPPIGDRTDVLHVISGSGTFIANRLTVKGRFRTTAEWKLNEHELKKEESGAFEAHGKYVLDQWFGEKLTGTFSSSISDKYCVSKENGVCKKWKTESTSCSGKIPSLLSSVESFKRK
jgi:pSer/pThr/pTyr-binding forkhead associated (FHA) protein